MRRSAVLLIGVALLFCVSRAFTQPPPGASVHPAPWRILHVSKLNTGRLAEDSPAAGPRKYLHVTLALQDARNPAKKHKFRVVDATGAEVGKLWAWDNRRSVVIFEGKWEDLSNLYLDSPDHRAPLLPRVAATVPPPAYVPPRPAYVPPQPAYVPSQPAYVPPQPVVRPEADRVVYPQPSRVILPEPDRVVYADPNRVVRTVPNRVIHTGPDRVIHEGGDRVIVHDGPDRVIVHDGPGRVIHEGADRVVVHHDADSVVHHDGDRVVHEGGDRVVHEGGNRVVHEDGDRVVHEGGNRVVHEGGDRVVHHDGDSVVHEGGTDRVVQDGSGDSVVRHEGPIPDHIFSDGDGSSGASEGSAAGEGSAGSDQMASAATASSQTPPGMSPDSQTPPGTSPSSPTSSDAPPGSQTPPGTPPESQSLPGTPPGAPSDSQTPPTAPPGSQTSPATPPGTQMASATPPTMPGPGMMPGMGTPPGPGSAAGPCPPGGSPMPGLGSGPGGAGCPPGGTCPCEALPGYPELARQYGPQLPHYAQAAYQNRCTQCHGPQRIQAAEKTMSPQQLQETVRRMAAKRPEQFRQRDIDLITHHLVRKATEDPEAGNESEVQEDFSHLVLYLTCGGEAGPGKVYQVNGEGRVLGIARLPSTATGIALHRNKNLILALPSDGGKIMRLDDAGRLSTILQHDRTLVHPVDVAVVAGADTLVVTDNIAKLVAATNVAGTEPRVYRRFQTSNLTARSMSVAIAGDNSVLLGTASDEGIMHLSGNRDSVSVVLLLPGGGSVAADPNSRHWAATQEPNQIYLFQDQQLVTKYRLPDGQSFYRHGLMSFAPAGAIVVATRPSEQSAGPIRLLYYRGADSARNTGLEPIRILFDWDKEPITDFVVGPPMFWNRDRIWNLGSGRE